MSTTTIWTRRSILAAGLFAWVALAVFATACIGVWLRESFWLMDYTLRADAVAGGMPWLILGAALSVVTLISGRLVGGRWWDSTLAVTPAIVVVFVELITGVAMTLYGHVLFLPAVVIAMVGIGGVIHATVRRLRQMPDPTPERTDPAAPPTAGA
ncbi:hypothetical protein ACWEOH_05975 [Agromyces sp. NPDC004153]